MTAPIPDPLVPAILKREKRRADAKAVLARPGSALPLLLVGPLIAIGVSNYFDGHSPSGHLFNVLLSCGLVALIALALESWAIRRRLEAAIVLLELEQDDAARAKNPVE